jgi:effector-binding domain-containing protein
MIDTPQIVRTTARQTAFLHLTIPREQIRDLMGPGINEVMAAVAAQGIALTGPWVAHHRKITPETFDFEIHFPVASPILAAGRVQPGEWPAMTVARTTYRGPYEGLAEAWGEFNDWVAAETLKPATDLWECYISGPADDSDPATWQTQLNRPLLD